ncbi:MAG: DNA polymerase I [bacterium]
MSKHPRLFLFDGMALAYRAYYAFIQRPLINSKGQNTSAIYGFVSFLNRILTDEQPDYIAVVFDTSAPTFRHKAYKEYKATRQKMPEDMISQLPLLKEVIKAYNIPVLELDGYEADDIIGTLAKQAEKEKAESFLVSSDKDFMQLVSDIVKIYKPGRQGNEVEVVDTEGVKKKFGVTPDKVIEVLGLIGDSSDNVPGVPGIGEKTAIPLIQQYGSIQKLYENIEKIAQKGVRSKLEIHKEMAFFSRELVTINTNVPLDLDFHDLKSAPKNISRLLALFSDLEFKGLAAELRKAEPVSLPLQAEEDTFFFSPETELTSITTDDHRYTLITEVKEFQTFCQQLQSANEFVFDTETTSTDALRAELVGISFSLKSRNAYFVSVVSPKAKTESDLFTASAVPATRAGIPLAIAIQRLKPIFENPNILKIGHNIKYDALVLSNYGIAVVPLFFDTMVASYLLRSDARHNLDTVAREHLHYKMVSYEELTGSGKAQKSILEVPLQALAEYSCEDADITLRLFERFTLKLKELEIATLASELEFPLMEVLTRMEIHGVKIDVEYLRGMSKELEKLLENLTREIHQLGGGSFNINSTQQLGEVLFKRLQLRTVRKTKTGFSTDVGVLEELRHDHPIVEKLLEYRQLSKLKSTYVEAIPTLVNPATGRVHTSYNQTIASTGRLSSSDPNLQNIPIRTEIGRSIRKAFIPGKKSFFILSADYSQIELRVMAHISGDAGMAEAFRNHEDIHTTTAAKVFGVTLEEVSRDMRRKAKEVNFGIMYGIGPFGLANRLEISQTEAKDIIARYFDRFPKVKQYINDTIASVRTKGYVETMLGRRRYLPEIVSKNQNIRQNAERQAINMPIQGTSADMIKLAMIGIDRELQKQELQTTMILQVHDELVFEMKKSEESVVRELIIQKMKNALTLSVPLEVEIGIGSNWLEAH